MFVSIHVTCISPSITLSTALSSDRMGCIKPESGTIRIFGYQPGVWESGVPGPGVGFMPQEIALHMDLTICEMISYFGRLGFIKADVLKERIESLLDVLELPPKTRLIGTLSGGQKRR